MGDKNKFILRETLKPYLTQEVQNGIIRLALRHQMKFSLGVIKIL
jgi:hypothetical protein